MERVGVILDCCKTPVQKHLMFHRMSAGGFLRLPELFIRILVLHDHGRNIRIDFDWPIISKVCRITAHDQLKPTLYLSCSELHQELVM